LSHLSIARRRLVNNIRLRRFGYFERLSVKDGEPVWDPPPEITSHIKFGSPTRSLPVHEPDGCTLAAPFSWLFDEFDRRKNFTIKCLQFQNGIPFDMKVKETLV
jgi:hypothetical protein